jgi:hypothetical protein
MRSVVSDQLERARIVAREDLDAAGPFDRVGKIPHHAIQRIGDGLLKQRFRDRSGELRASRARSIIANGAIGK